MVSATSPNLTTSQSAGIVPQPGNVLPFAVPAGNTSSQQLVEQGVRAAVRWR